MRSDSIFHAVIHWQEADTALVSDCLPRLWKCCVFCTLQGVCICCRLVLALGLPAYACSIVFICAENRENSFSRSRSSSVSSIDRDSKEAITALYFMESFARKNDSAVSPCLWVGTGLGMVLILSLNLPASDDLRQSEPVMVSPSGKSAAVFLFLFHLGTRREKLHGFARSFWQKNLKKCIKQWSHATLRVHR